MGRWSGHRRILLFAALAGGAVLPARGSAPAVQSTDMTRAFALAQLGAQDAETRLKAYFPFRAFDAPGSPRPYRYWGADPTETVEPTLGHSPENAVNPSFAVEADGNPANADPTPRTLAVEGAPRGFTGVDGAGTYATNGDHYALKVSDLSGRIYVNDGIDGGPAGSVSQNLKRILNCLGAIRGVAGLGDAVLAARPAAGYADLADLVPVVGGPASFDLVRDLLTAHAWVDRNVANPVPLSISATTGYPVAYYRGSPPVYRFGSSLDSAGLEVVPPGGFNTIPNVGMPLASERPSVSVYGLDSLNPQWIEIVSRAPVNVNAAPREVLVALLTDLKGFFIAERRRNNPRWGGDLFLSFKIQSSMSPSGTEGDEVGFLMETCPIVGPGGTAPTGISAFTIADEIVACRERKATTYFNYASVPWGGPFRTWRQFHAFVDNLVSVGVIDDPRPIHVRYEVQSNDPAGFGALVVDPVARAHAARAIADAIKANFNPNLHLNELNPDENLFLRVDKTDLVVHSTEFCFVPTGHFEVQSVGRVVRPKDASADALAAADNECMAQAKLTAVFRLYDLHRETSQKHFYAGSTAARTGAFETNNNMSLETGPEPDNGVFPGNLGAPGLPDNEWDGYLALPTIGGPWHSNPNKLKNTLAATLGLAAAPQYNSAIHAHYTLDSDACHHVLDRQEIAGRSLPDEQVVNHPDSVGGVQLPYGGPYDPTKGAGHRACKSFRRPTGGPDPALPPHAPGDLRLDGVYAERHSAPAYYAHLGTSSVWNFSAANAQGMVSFWVKPSFHPELTGKVRKLWDMTRYHSPCGQNVNVSPFEAVFLPVHYDTLAAESSQPRFWANNMGQFLPSSMYFGSRQWHFDDIFTSGNGHQFGKITTSLNHLDHWDNPACATKPSVFRGHRWTNVTLSWTLTGTPDPSGERSQLRINGTTAWTPFSHLTMTGGWSDGTDRMNGFERHSGGAFNHMRLGGTSRVADAAVALLGGYRGNYSPDFTYDELYVWLTEADASPDLLWIRGRYSNPAAETSGEGAFVSQAISLPPAGAVRVLGASWTWYGEGLDAATGAATLYDYNSPLSIAGTDLQPQVRLTIRDGASIYGPYDNDGLSDVRLPDTTIPVIADPSQVKYSVHFRLPMASLSSILLTTPVLDDVTLYWEDGRANTRVDGSSPVALANPPPGGGGGGGGGAGGGGGGCGLTGFEGGLLVAMILAARRASRFKLQTSSFKLPREGP